jgi:hypothetical protein
MTHRSHRTTCGSSDWSYTSFLRATRTRTARVEVTRETVAAAPAPPPQRTALSVRHWSTMRIPDVGLRFTLPQLPVPIQVEYRPDENSAAPESSRNAFPFNHLRAISSSETGTVQHPPFPSDKNQMARPDWLGRVFPDQTPAGVRHAQADACAWYPSEAGDCCPVLNQACPAAGNDAVRRSLSCPYGHTANELSLERATGQLSLSIFLLRRMWW